MVGATDCLDLMRSHSTEWLEARRCEVVAQIRRLQSEEHSILFVLDERGRVDVREPSRDPIADGLHDPLVRLEILLVVGINHSLVHAAVGTGVTTNTTLVASDFYLPVTALKN